ncbi:hypothetical protein ACFXG4_47400 [Nocardia sp. NPDC059246]|uniref:hypothetical protein n=1 Tax=unclassified Nocardia TaxID=2637762 RepID=UPI00368EF91E
MATRSINAPKVRVWCSVDAIELVLLPTYSLWLNRIECEFAALRYFALNGTDHCSHGEQDDAIGTYVRWRSQHAELVGGFAVGSKIRHPDYLTSAIHGDLGTACRERKVLRPATIRLV